jgi:hypothetical protein
MILLTDKHSYINRQTQLYQQTVKTILTDQHNTDKHDYINRQTLLLLTGKHNCINRQIRLH